MATTASRVPNLNACVWLMLENKQKCLKQQWESGSETLTDTLFCGFAGAEPWTVTDQPDSVGGPLCSVYEAVFCSRLLLIHPQTPRPVHCPEFSGPGPHRFVISAERCRQSCQLTSRNHAQTPLLRKQTPLLRKQTPLPHRANGTSMGRPEGPVPSLGL